MKRSLQNYEIKIIVNKYMPPGFMFEKLMPFDHINFDFDFDIIRENGYSCRIKGARYGYLRESLLELRMNKAYAEWAEYDARLQKNRLTSLDEHDSIPF